MAFDLCGHEGGKPSADVVPASNGGLFEREHHNGIAALVGLPAALIGLPDREGLETPAGTGVGTGGALEEVLEHGSGQRFAKAPGAAKQYGLISHQDVFDEHGLVHKDASVVDRREPVAARSRTAVARGVGHQGAGRTDDTMLITDQGVCGGVLDHGVLRCKRATVGAIVPRGAAWASYSWLPP